MDAYDGAEVERALEEFLRMLEADEDDGAAAKAHLAAGRPIYYCEDCYPVSMIRKWPDGRRELVNVDEKGKIAVISELAPVLP